MPEKDKFLTWMTDYYNNMTFIMLKIYMRARQDLQDIGKFRTVNKRVTHTRRHTQDLTLIKNRISNTF